MSTGRFLINFTVGLHLISAWGGAAIGGYETYNPGTRYFSNNHDDLYTASARGFVRGVYYPYNTLSHVPKVWNEEKPPFIK